MSNHLKGKTCRPLTPFASRTLTEHLIRGGLALSGIYFIFNYYTEWPIFSYLLVPFIFFALRGCPMCWITGLIDTIAMKLRK